jgi:spermidine synthase
MQVNAADLAVRLEERRIQTDLVSPPYLEYRLQPQWLTTYKRAVDPLPRRINSDFRPLAVFYGLSYWNALYSPYLENLFTRTEGTRPSTIMILIAIVTLAVAALFLFGRARAGMPLPYAIATTGFCGMVFDLAIIFTFQTIFGYLYYQIGLLVTVFMAGATLSSLLATRRLEGLTDGTVPFLISELCLVVFAGLLPLTLIVPSRFLDKPTVNLLLHFLFLLMSFTSGALTGFQFPLAAHLHLEDTARSGAGSPAAVAQRALPTSSRIPHTAGLLYGADLVGGYFGGLIGGVILLPILGLWNTCLILAMIKGSSFIVILLRTLLWRKTNTE